MILAGDVGGTKAVVALFPDDGGPALCKEKFPSSDFDGLEPLIAAFLTAEGTDLDEVRAACFGIAGPVHANRVAASNLPWEIDGDRVARSIDVPKVTLLNDLVAMAWGLDEVAPGCLEELNAGREDPYGHRAVVAPGTGLGMCILARTPGGWMPMASEGGHVDFAPRTPRQWQLKEWLAGRHGHVSAERVASGMGIANLYRFLSETGSPVDEAIASELSSADDPTPGIVRAAVEGRCPVCSEVLDLFGSILGAVAGDLALTCLPRGGLYLGGGMSIRLLDLLSDGGFLASFRDKGRFEPIMRSIPVRVILDPEAPLLGAARVARAAVDPPSSTGLLTTA